MSLGASLDGAGHGLAQVARQGVRPMVQTLSQICRSPKVPRLKLAPRVSNSQPAHRHSRKLCPKHFITGRAHTQSLVCRDTDTDLNALSRPVAAAQAPTRVLGAVLHLFTQSPAARRFPRPAPHSSTSRCFTQQPLAAASHQVEAWQVSWFWLHGSWEKACFCADWSRDVLAAPAFVMAWSGLLIEERGMLRRRRRTRLRVGAGMAHVPNCRPRLAPELGQLQCS